MQRNCLLGPTSGYHARLSLRFVQVERRIDGMVTRLGAVVVVVAGLLFAALHYWPPHS